MLRPCGPEPAPGTAWCSAATLPADTRVSWLPGRERRLSLPPRSGLGLATLARRIQFSDATVISDVEGTGQDRGCDGTHTFLGPTTPTTAARVRRA